MQPIIAERSRFSRSQAALFALVGCVALPLFVLAFLVIVQAGYSVETSFFTGIATLCIAATGYLLFLYSKNALWYSAPALVTIRAVIEFAFVPTSRLWTGVETIDRSYPRAIFVVILGMAAFWTGSLVVFRKQQAEFHSDDGTASDRRTLVAYVLLIVGLAAKTAMWKAGLNAYVADELSRTAAASYIQWLMAIASLLQASMIVAAIEIFSKRHKSPGIWIVFWASLVLTLGFASISGMKEEILAPLVQLVLVYVLIRRRMPRAALLLPLVLIVIYPFVNAYRDNLNAGYRASANSVDGLTALLEKSFQDVTSPNNDVAGEGVSNTSERLALLNPVRLVITLPSPSLLKGDEKLWMIPIYPFVPRAVWPSKPVLNKGQRFTEALGQGRESSTAVTPFADLYLLGGYTGVIIGMFVYGLLLQFVMNWMIRHLSAKTVFVYVMIVLVIINLENDVFSLATAFIDNVVIYTFFAQLVYGGKWFGSVAQRRRGSTTLSGAVLADAAHNL